MKLLNSEVRIETTNLCNAKCTICARDRLKRPLTTMSMDMFRRLVDEVKSMGAETISVFGFGEPLLDINIAEKIGYCTDNGLKTFITTNSSLLDVKRSRELIDAGLSHIRFSAHGLYKNYEKVHRGIKFDTFFRHTISFIKMSDGLVTISVSAIPLHGESVESFVEFWKPGNMIDYLEVWKPHNWTSVKDYRGNTIQRKKTCGRPFSGPLQIQADGTVIVCCFDYNGKIVVGDTNKESIYGILKGAKFKAIREKHRSGNLYDLPCENCDQLNIGNDNPLLYSNRDPERKINCTSSTKFTLKEKEND